MPEFTPHPVAYERLSGGSRDDVEIVLNTLDRVPPKHIQTVDGHTWKRLPTAPLPGKPSVIPMDWTPTPGRTLAIVRATEEWAVARAEEVADLRWETSPATREEFESRDELAMVLLMGYQVEVMREGWCVQTIPGPPTPDTDGIDPGF